MPRINFSEEALRALRPPAEGRTTYWDKDVKGWGLRITSNGARTFVVQRRLNGKAVTVTVCDFTGRNLKAARAEVDKAIALLTAGKNPTNEKRTARNQTLGMLAEQFIKAELRTKRQGHQCESFLRRDWLGQQRRPDKWRRKKTANGWRLIRLRPSTVDKRQPDWTDGGDRTLRDAPVRSITREQIVRRLDGVRAERNQWAARHALDAIRRLMNWCAQGGIIDVSPVASLTVKRATGLTGGELRRERVLTDVELHAIWHAAGSDAFGSLVRLLMLTGQRLGDWAKASWPEITRTDDGDVLVIPGTRYKNKREHSVPLTPAVVKLLQRLPRHDGCDWLLTNDGSVPLSSVGKAKRRLDKASGVTDWQLHDLRRTVRSAMPPLGVSRDVSERLLGHAQQMIDKHYDHFNYTPLVRKALEAWERRLEGILKAKRLPASRQRALPASRLEIVS